MRLIQFNEKNNRLTISDGNSNLVFLHNINYAVVGMLENCCDTVQLVCFSDGKMILNAQYSEYKKYTVEQRSDDTLVRLLKNK